MGLLTKPVAYIDNAVWSASDVNALLNALYDTFGSLLASPGGGTGEGLIDNDNIKTGAAIRATKIGDTAVVCGNTINAGMQTITRPTKFGAGTQYVDGTTANVTATAVSDGAVTIAVGSSTRFVHLTYAGTVANAVIATITGGTVGQMVTFVGTVSGTKRLGLYHTEANATNNIKLLVDPATLTGTKIDLTDVGGPRRASMGTFIFGDLNASSTNQWWQV